MLGFYTKNKSKMENKHVSCKSAELTKNVPWNSLLPRIAYKINLVVVCLKLLIYYYGTLLKILYDFELFYQISYLTEARPPWWQTDWQVNDRLTGSVAR